MKKTFFYVAAVAILAGVLCACSEKNFPGYEKNQNGLYYKFFSQNEGKQPEIGELLDVGICCFINDTNAFIPYVENTMQLAKPLFAGDLFEGMAMMHKGDSASFIVKIDSTFIKMMGYPSLPKEYKPTDIMRFEVRVDDIYPENEFPQHYAAKIRKMNEEHISQMKAAHPEETAQAAQELAEYLSANGVEAQPTASGLYYVRTVEGNGEKPISGQMVTVHYTGKLLDGTVFDSSVERGVPYNTAIGVGQVIPGWDEGILMMSKGEKGVLYIPYYLAYGDMGSAPAIPPYANLVFEVELIDFQ